jgi:sodium transport system permease protein
MGKELYRVFSDKKMIFGLFIMPAILVIGIFLLMGVFAASLLTDLQEHEPTVIIYQAPDSFLSYMDNYRTSGDCYEVDGIVFHVSYESDEATLSEAKNQIYEGTLDLILTFPKDFDTLVAGYSGGSEIPEVQTYYNPSEDYSDNAHSDALNSFVEGYRNSLLEERFGDLDCLSVFTIDTTNEDVVIQNDNKAQGKMLGSVIPYMITILLFASAMNLGADSFAGEKERGTMASLLMTPIKRSQIVYGKLFALMILSGLSALIYGGAMIFAMPLLYRTLGTMTGQDLSFPPSQMSMMLVLIVTLVFLYEAIIALCTTLAKNMKEASTFITPVYLVIMVLGMFTIFQGDDVSVMQYLIPLFGPTMALKNVFTLDITLAGFLLATASNLITGALFAWLTTRLFHSEKIMFNA